MEWPVSNLKSRQLFKIIESTFLSAFYFGKGHQSWKQNSCSLYKCLNINFVSNNSVVGQ